MAVGFGLLRDKVDNILVLDENPAGYEGPWVTYARMVTLRTPKYLTGPDLGVASLTFRAFWEAQYGEESWAAVGKIRARSGCGICAGFGQRWRYRFRMKPRLS